MKTLLIKNIGRLVTMSPSGGRSGALGVIEDAALRANGGVIEWIGPNREANQKADETIDAEGGVVMPGLVDCHTHLVHAGSRQNEFRMRAEGKTYREIAEAGGGIMSTVRATRGASLGELCDEAARRADEALSRGVTTIEIKTGYGLDIDTEIKIADVIGRLHDENPIEVVGTFLAHIIPPESIDNRVKYVELIVDDILPAISTKKWISACDVFVEDIAFKPDEARAIARRASDLGLALHFHVDQFSDGRGAELAAEFGALSADHLDHASERGLKALAKTGVTAVVLPGASFFAGGGHYPDARKMIAAGVKVAISTDYNPGTAPSLDLFLNASIAVTQMKMTCDEALMGITRYAAKALGLSDRGFIERGMRADLTVLHAPDEYFPLYRYGCNFVRMVIVGGRSIDRSGG